MDSQFQSGQEQSHSVPLSPEVQTYLEKIVNQCLQAQNQQYNWERATREQQFTAESAELRSQIDMLLQQLQFKM